MRPLGVFDSGVGGLSVLREIRRRLPAEDVVYLADQAHVPYGGRDPAEVRALCLGAFGHLVARGAKVVVVACNTGSAAALEAGRRAFPRVPFVGMEPAVKPAAACSRAGVVGVLATAGTLRGEPYGRVVDRFARGTRVVARPCPGLVEAVEAGETDGPRVRAALAEALTPLLAEGADTLVLGCTHYPFALPVIRELCGPGVEVIDPAPAVARQVARVLEAAEALAPAGAPGRVEYGTTGSPEAFARAVEALLGERFPAVSFVPPEALAAP